MVGTMVATMVAITVANTGNAPSIFEPRRIRKAPRAAAQYHGTVLRGCSRCQRVWGRREGSGAWGGVRRNRLQCPARGTQQLSEGYDPAKNQLRLGENLRARAWCEDHCVIKPSLKTKNSHRKVPTAQAQLGALGPASGEYTHLRVSFKPLDQKSRAGLSRGDAY